MRPAVAGGMARGRYDQKPYCHPILDGLTPFDAHIYECYMDKSLWFIEAKWTTTIATSNFSKSLSTFQ